MVIRRYGLGLALAVFASFAVAVRAVAIDFPTAVFRWVDSAAAFVWGLVDDLAKDFALPSDEPDDAGSWHVDSLDPALANSLRHEAGMRPLRC